MKRPKTDKFSHGYVDFYRPFFETLDAKKVVEIGVYHGESLKYLNNTFPDADIYGIDILDKTNFDDPKNNIKTFVCDQSDPEQLMNTFEQDIDCKEGEIDLIIDDGGHTMMQQQISLGHLFKYVKPGGLYIIEDLHTSRISNRNFIHPDDRVTTLDMIQNFRWTGHLISDHISIEDASYIMDSGEVLDIYTKDASYSTSVAAIIRKKLK